MFITFTVPVTGNTHKVDLRPELIQEYRVTVEEMKKYNSPSLDRVRRQAHNKLSQPVLSVLQSELPDLELPQLAIEARQIVATFLEQSLTGRSTVRELLNSGLPLL